MFSNDSNLKGTKTSFNFKSFIKAIWIKICILNKDLNKFINSKIKTLQIFQKQLFLVHRDGLGALLTLVL